MHRRTLGTFSTTSGKLLVTDPVFDPPRATDAITFALVLEIPDDTWTASALSNDDGPVQLDIVREGRDKKSGETLKKIGAIGTDSPMVAMFDLGAYTEAYDAQGRSAWREHVFGEGTGVEEFGVFAENGIGAGFFPVFAKVAKKGGAVNKVSVRLGFFGD